MALRAIKDRWKILKARRTALKAGFQSHTEYSEAISHGFLTKKARMYLQSNGFQNIEEMTADWDKTYFDVNALLKSESYLNMQMVKDSTSLEQIDNLEQHLQPYLKELNQSISEISRVLEIQMGIFKLFASNNKELFTDLGYEQLEDQNLLFNVTYDTIIRAKEELLSEIKDRKQWYIGWQKYAAPMKIVDNWEPISLNKISQLISASLDQEEQKLLILLREDKKLDYEITKHRYICQELGFQVLMLME